nr:hypothetical protein [Candidatus Cloacimonadota bacterium]
MDNSTYKKIIITCPRSNAGGVYQFVKNVLPFIPYSTHVLYRGSLKSDNSIIKVLRSITSVWITIRDMIKIHPELILVNSSLSKECLIRDGVIIRLARFFCIRPILIIHGFQESALQYTWLLNRSYFKSDMIFVLAKSFADKLSDAGYEGEIISQFNPVDHNLIEHFSTKILRPEISTFLFLARIEEIKGIFIALDTFKIYKISNPNIKMLVAGTGGALEAAQEYVQTHDIKDVKFLGFVSGYEKEEAFRQSDLMIFPSFNEGLPISVLEAMSAGLLIVTRPVGGLVDLYSKIDFGGITESIDPSDYIEIINRLVKENRILERKRRNQDFAFTNFHPQRIVSKIISEINS